MKDSGFSIPLGIKSSDESIPVKQGKGEVAEFSFGFGGIAFNLVFKVKETIEFGPMNHAVIKGGEDFDSFGKGVSAFEGFGAGQQKGPLALKLDFNQLSILDQVGCLLANAGGCFAVPQVGDFFQAGQAVGLQGSENQVAAVFFLGGDFLQDRIGQDSFWQVVDLIKADPVADIQPSFHEKALQSFFGGFPIPPAAGSAFLGIKIPGAKRTFHFDAAQNIFLKLGVFGKPGGAVFPECVAGEKRVGVVFHGKNRGGVAPVFKNASLLHSFLQKFWSIRGVSAP